MGLLVLLFVFGILGFVGTESSITISNNVLVSNWEGWGTSLAWWASVFGSREDLADAIFTLDNPTTYTPSSGQQTQVPGLGLNIARYNAGACSNNTYDDSSIVLSSNMKGSYSFRAMEGYWIDWGSSSPFSSSWDWSRDQNQREMMISAEKRGANLFELFSNSPMWWMCYNHNPGGDNNGGNNLQTWNYQNHTVYLANIAQYARENWNITFNSVEPFNEPSSDWWVGTTATQEGCHVDPNLQAEIIPFMREGLDSRGELSIDVAVSDENSYDLATSTWNSFSDSVKQNVGKVNVHGYEYQNGRRDLLYDAVSSDGKRLWNSEYGDGETSASLLTQCLLLDFYWLHMSAWVYWQALDSGGWGLISSNPGDNWIGDPTVKWYAVAQFSRHIRPGAQILQTNSQTTAAAFHPTSQVLVVVCSGVSGLVQFDVSDFQFKDPNQILRSWMTETEGGGMVYQESESIQLQNGKYFEVQFQDSSQLITVELQGASN